MKNIRGSFVCAAVLAGVVAGCASSGDLYENKTVSSSEDAANVYVSVYPAIPWAEIRDKLAPKHNLTTEQARAMASQVTQIQVSQMLSVLSAGLGIGLPGRSDTTSTAIAADGTRTTTGSSTRSSGAIPTASGATSTVMGEGALAPDLSKAPYSTAIDANESLTAGTALFQQAQILDNQITHGVEPNGYQAHLITFQVNLQPKQRGLAYDAYVNVSILPGSWKQALEMSAALGADASELPPVVIYPLIITDAMEATSSARSIEAVRQGALQLAGVIGQVGVNAGVNQGSDKLQSVLGQDQNSLVTVGRVNDHTLRIRLGAPNSSRSGWAMVPRTYNVSTVVFTRFNANDRNKSINTLSAVTETTLVSALDGTPLPSSRLKSRGAVTERAQRLFAVFNEFKMDDAACSVFPPEAKTPGANDAQADKGVNTARDLAYLNLLRAVERADYNFVSTCLNLPDFHLEDPAMGARRVIALRRLLAEMITLQTDSRYSKLLIPLRPPQKLQLPPPNQYALMTDDGKSAASVIVRDGGGLGIGQLKAALDPSQANCATPPAAGTRRLLATAVEVVNGGAEVRLKFPSLAALNSGQASVPRMELAFYNNVDEGNGPIATACYELTKVNAPPAAPPPPANPVSTAHNVLVASSDGVARIGLQIGEFPDDIKTPVRLVISGADVRPDAAAGALVQGAKGVGIGGDHINPNSAVTLVLGNLSPITTVSIATVTTIKEKDVQIGSPIVLHVDRQPPLRQ